MKRFITIMLISAVVSQAAAQTDTILANEIEKLKAQNVTLSEKLNKIKPGNNKFRMTGFANFSYHQDLEDFDISRFAHAGFAPIMIWKPSDNLFFESELHIELEGGVHGGETGDGGHGGGGHGGGGGGISHAGATHLDLGYANIGYFVNDWITLVGGKFLSPFGTFNERFHPSWINRLPSAPLGFGHGGATPVTELGMQLRGGLQLGKSKLYYAVYVSNGPILEDGKGDPENAGALIYTNFQDNNANKAIGGRLGILPFSNSSLDLGVSGQYAGKTGDLGTPYENVSALLYALDLTYVKDFGAIGGTVRIVGQYSIVDVEDVYYINDSMDIAMGEDSLYTFNNESSLYYIQLAYRPDKSGKEFLRNLEFVVRYDVAKLSPGSKWEFEDSRTTFGLNYWIHARSAFKFEVRISELGNIAMFQWSIGF